MARSAGLQPVSEAWEWQMQGRCRDRSGTQFFHPDDDLGRISRRLREAAAKRLCADCPVRRQCATHALTVGEEYGVWGGFSENDRLALREAGWHGALDEGRLADVGWLERRLQQITARRAKDKQRLRDEGGLAGGAGRTARQQSSATLTRRPTRTVGAGRVGAAR